MSVTLVINICGLGFVGGSIARMCKRNKVKFNAYDIRDLNTNDIGAEKSYNNIISFVENSECNNDLNFYFVCVPTPCKQSGECDTSIVETVVDELYRNHSKKTYILIKSTIQPGTSRKLSNMYKKDTFNVIFVPEFLTEKNANEDMYSAKFTLMGTRDGIQDNNVTMLFKKLYSHNPNIDLITRKYETLEIFKYTVNVFLAVKVWFFNEIYQVCEKCEVDYNEVRNLLHLDSRIGQSHTMVPGHDGKFGYGGSCFIKDTAAFRFLQNSLDIPDDVIKSIIERNHDIRES